MIGMMVERTLDGLNNPSIFCRKIDLKRENNHIVVVKNIKDKI